MKKNVAGQLISAQMVSATDGSDVTAGTCNVAVEVDGAAGTGGTATHIANGKWEYAPIQADTNGDYLTFQFVISGALTTTVQVYTHFPQSVDNDVLLTTVQADLDTITDTDGVILGAAGVDLIWDEPLTGGTHNVAQSSGRRLRGVQEFQGYEGGAVWIDTINGATGTTDYEFGTVENPVATIAEANTIATSLNLHKFFVESGSTVTLAASQTDQVFEGQNWTLALGGQNIDGSTFLGAKVSGIGTNTTGEQYFIDCTMGACTLPGDTHVKRSGLSGTQTFGEPGDYFYDGCDSEIAGSGSVTLDFATPATETNVSVRHHSGGWTVANMGAGAGTCNASFEGNGQITWAASCAATSNASIRGNWKITDSASGAVTETLDDNTTSIAAIEADTALILADTGTDGVVLSSATQTAIADALLNRDMSAVSDTTARSPLNALRLLRNKYSVAGTTLTVTKEDDSTSAWTSTLTTDAAADPVTGSDPA